MIMMMSYASIISSCVVVLLTYCGYRFVNWIWLKPKRLEKCLRRQGFKGNPYKLFVGDKKECGLLIAEAMSKPIKLTDYVPQRVIPHVVHTIQKYGEKSFIWEGRIPRAHIFEPEIVKEILVNHNRFRRNVHDHDPTAKLIQSGFGLFEDELWTNRKRILNMAFQAEKLKLMLPQIYSSCLDMVSKWEDKISKNGGSVEVEAHNELRYLSGDILSRTLFGSTFKECEEIFKKIEELLSLVIETMRKVYIPGRRFLPTKKNRRMKQLNQEALDLVMVIVHKKMKALESGEISRDFLGILLEYNFNQSKNKSNHTITIEEIIDEAKHFYFAGNDSVANLMAWTLLLLSTNPEWQKRAREEILQAFGDGVPTYDGISHLKILNMILCEVLRLYPPVPEISKIVREDMKIGDLILPAGAQVMIPTIMIHHDPEIWGKDVREFKPERFAEGVSKATKKQGQYIPFSLGQRNCIGQNYALIELKMVFAILLTRFSFELSPSYKHAPYNLLAMKPQFGVPLIIRKL